jgi:hypothetical protein
MVLALTLPNGQPNLLYDLLTANDAIVPAIGVSLGVPTQGLYWVNDPQWAGGAVSRNFNDATPITNAERTQNVNAINAALAAAYANGGGTVLFGPGVYYTNGTVGYFLAIDVNVGVTIQGLGPFPTMIQSNNATVPNFQIFTTTGNIRSIYMKDLTLRGGRTSLSLVRCNYCRFERIFFWGADDVAKQFALQDYLGFSNKFVECYFTESSRGEAAIFINSGDEMIGTTFGEAGGGIVVLGGSLIVNGGDCFGVWYRNGDYTDYWTNPAVPVTVSMAFFLNRASAFIVSGGSAVLSHIFVGLGKVFLTLDSAYNVGINGCYVLSGSASGTPPGSGNFQGFIDVMNNAGNRLALSIAGGQYVVQGGAPGDSGYFVKDNAGNLHDAVVSTQLVVETGGTLTQLGILGGLNNLALFQQFNRV